MTRTSPPAPAGGERAEVSEDETTPRGRDADEPHEIPGPGWRDIAWRIWAELGDDHVTVVAAGVAFYGLIAIFPALAALISIAGLMVDPATVQDRVSEMVAILPPEAGAIVTAQAEEIASRETSDLGIAILIGISLSLYSASRGMATLMEGMNIAYDEVEKRGLVRATLISFLLTLVMVGGVLTGLAFVLLLPGMIERLGVSNLAELLLALGRWVVLAAMTMVGLAVIFRFGPSRENARWQWVSWGAIAATALWIAGSIAFSVYASNFATYDRAYGTLGGVVILLTWLWLSSYIVLLGAELNAEMEHQTAQDTTTGPEQPMGERGAVKADTTGRVP